MSCEQSPGSQLGVVVNILDDCLGDCETVVSARTTPHFVEYQQTPPGALSQEVSGFQHLHQKRALARTKVILCSDAREYAVDEADLRVGGRHEATDLRHQNDKRCLPQIRRLTCHIGPGQYDYLVVITRYMNIVRYERRIPSRHLDDRVAAIRDLKIS